MEKRTWYFGTAGQAADGDTLEALVNKFNEESDTVHVGDDTYNILQ